MANVESGMLLVEKPLDSIVISNSEPLPERRAHAGQGLLRGRGLRSALLGHGFHLGAGLRHAGLHLRGLRAAARRFGL